MTKEEQELRHKIAEDVADKMNYMNTCLNERDIILDIIKGKRIPREIHCATDCTQTDCKCYMFGKGNLTELSSIGRYDPYTDKFIKE